ncbi:MAG: GGDEF domain-containing protein [Minisyncoccales bacterium]
MKKDLNNCFYYTISIALIFFIVLLGGYFYSLFKSGINSITNTLYSIKDSINQNDFSILTSNISEIFSLFITQILIFLFLTITLIIIITYLFRLYSIQKRDSLIDPLTRIYNRKAVLMGLKKEIKRAERFKHHLSIAIIDIDFFKKYNDTNGHVQGDEALKKFASILKKNSRDLDLVGRIGGEEFLMVFPETKLNETKRICERIRKEIEKASFKGEKNLPDKKLTTSIGIASLNSINSSEKNKSKKLIKEADKKLYKSKETTRNVVN